MKKTIIMATMLLFSASALKSMTGEYFKEGTITAGKWKGKKISLRQYRTASIPSGEVPRASIPSGEVEKPAYNGPFEATILQNNKVIKKIRIDRCATGGFSTQEYVTGQAKLVYKDADGNYYTCYYKTNQ